MKRRLHGQKQAVRGSGDFLKDMGYADPDEMRVKFTLANAIALAIEDHALTQDDAAKITGLAQSDVLRIVNGVVKEYAVFRLMRALAALGKDISIEISNSASEQGMIVARPSDANDAAVAGYSRASDAART
jgi:predicted XRE-type DNA-binding protein